MNFVGSQYYKLSEVLLTTIGLWPYRDFRLRCTQVCIFTVILISGIVVQLTVFATREYSFDLLLKVFAYSGPWINYTIKYLASVIRAKEIKNVMTKIQHDWSSLADDVERAIMHKHTKYAELVTVSCILFAYVSMISFVLLEYVPNILDIIVPLNVSRTHHFPVLIEYFVDQEKYFSLILLHVIAVLFTGITVVLATELALLSYIVHLAGMFELVCYRTQYALNERHFRAYISEDSSALYRSVVENVRVYREVLKFTGFLKSTFMLSYHAMLPIGIATLSLNLYRLSLVTKLDDFEDFCISSLFVLSHFGYLFFCHYMMQIITDNANTYFNKTYETDWYATPLKVQKLILLILQRGMTVPAISVLGFYVPTMEGYISLARMSVSYFMVIRSLE